MMAAPTWLIAWCHEELSRLECGRHFRGNQRLRIAATARGGAAPGRRTSGAATRRCRTRMSSRDCPGSERGYDPGATGNGLVRAAASGGVQRERFGLREARDVLSRL